MRFLTTVGGEAIGDLVARAYELGPAPARGLARQARAAVLDANPFLAAIADVPEGTVVAVPDVDGAAFGAATVADDDAAMGAGVSQFEGLLALVSADVLASAAAASASGASAVKTLKSTEVKALARGNEQLAAALPDLVAAAAARADAGRRLAAYARAAFGQLEDDLGALRGGS